jgi:hypothetical protein
VKSYNILEKMKKTSSVTRVPIVSLVLVTGGRLTEIQLIEIVFYHLIEIMLIT